MTDRGGLLRLAALLAALPAALALAVGVAVALAVEEPFAALVRDVQVTAEVPLYVGALSNLTVMAWTAGAAVALAAAVPRALRGDRLADLLLVLGLLGLAFAVDDAFQVHDGLAQIVGIPGGLVLVGYLVVIAFASLRYRGVLKGRPEVPILATAALLLALSLGVDVLVEQLPERLVPPESPRILVEDGSKLIGAALWSAFLVALARGVESRRAP